MMTLQGRYRLVEPLATGGFGAVWLAHDEQRGGLCAVKQSHADHPELAQILEAEATLLAGLNHPALPRIRDHFLIDGCAYLVMDYIEGGDLAMLLANQPHGVPAARVVEWAGALCAAVQYLHTLPQPVLHRDIKPSNVKLTPDGRVVLIDFGIARELTAVTISLQHAVTPGYSPPEQYRGETDPRSDVYALAATFYALLTGKTPLSAPERLAGATLPPPSALRPDLGAALDEPVMWALDLDPEQRPQSPTQLAAALAAALRQTGPAQAPAAPTKSGRRSRWWWIATALLLTLLLAAGMAARISLGKIDVTPTTVADVPPPTSVPSPTVAPTPTAASPPTAAATSLPAKPALAGALFYGEKEASGEYQIYRLATDGAPPQRLTSRGSNYGGQLSPDGRRIAFTSERDGREQIYVMDIDGTNQQRISQDSGLSQYPSWSPDGKSLVYVYNPDPASIVDDPRSRIVVQRLDEAAAQVLVESWGAWPTWGAAGIVFTSRDVVGGDDQLSISLVQPDGSGLRLINPTRDRDESYPNWSPDGQQLLFIAGDSQRPAERQVWVMDADGTNPHPLTSGIGGVALPTWSPDGRWVAFLAKWGGGAAFNIWVVPAEGGPAKPLTVTDAAKFGLGWGR